MTGPLDKENSSGGGPYSSGFYNSNNGQFVLVNVDDDGGSTITVTFTGTAVTANPILPSCFRKNWRLAYKFLGKRR
jgi:hypothetical protein